LFTTLNPSYYFRCYGIILNKAIGSLSRRNFVFVLKKLWKVSLAMARFIIHYF
jgi:hypothetical protein